MSTSATAIQTTREAGVAPPPTWKLTTDGTWPGFQELNGAVFQIEETEPEMDGRNVIWGRAHNASGTPFDGFYDSERVIYFDLTIDGGAYTFYGVISPSGKNMRGYVTPGNITPGNLIRTTHNVEEDASWSAQARPALDDDLPGRGQDAAEKGRS